MSRDILKFELLVVTAALAIINIAELMQHVPRLVTGVEVGIAIAAFFIALLL